MTGIYGAPRSPGRGHTIKSLRALSESHFHNPDTKTELQEEEAKTHLHHLEQNKTNRVSASHINRAMKMRTRSRGRTYIDHPVFRNIHGHVVPFRESSEVWL